MEERMQILDSFRDILLAAIITINVKNVIRRGQEKEGEDRCGSCY